MTKTYSLAEALESGKKFRMVDAKTWILESRHHSRGVIWTTEEVCARYVLKEEPREWDVMVTRQNQLMPVQLGLQFEKIRVREILED